MTTANVIRGSVRRERLGKEALKMKMSLPDGCDELQVIHELANHFLLKRKQSAAKNIGIYDTFDWRLFEKSLVLYSSDSELILYRLSDYKIVGRTKVRSFPSFVREFPDGDLKTLLAPILDVRALLKLAEIHSKTAIYRILNQEEKTVARLNYEEIRLANQVRESALSSHLCIEPVRGYPRYYRTAVKRLRKMGSVQIKPEALYFNVLKKVNKTPGDYSSKLRLQLEPDMRSDEAAKVILRFLVGIIKINGSYIEEDLDTEFLHDFRVAVRRTRVALSQIKQVFPTDTTKQFQKDFAVLGKLSNELRDLDVYLLKEDIYEQMLPEDMRDAIKSLFQFLKAKRLQVFESVKNSLHSREYAEIIRKWEVFLGQPCEHSPIAPNAAVPIIDLARKRIHKRYTEILRTGAGILEESNDEQLHSLRIECKKLRYLMEFFSSLFSSEKISILIKELKVLQDHLGDSNDLRVQRDYLQKTADELPITDQRDRGAILAIGSLIGSLEGQIQAAKRSFSDVFARFTSPKNGELYHELFVPSEGSVRP